MSEKQTNVAEILGDLLQQEQATLFHYLLENTSCAEADVGSLRRLLCELAQASDRHAAALIDLLDAYGGTPRPRQPRMKHQYLAYLSLRYLAPALIAAKQEKIEAYQKAAAVSQDDSRIAGVVAAHLAEHQRHLALLEQAFAVGAGSPRPAP